MSKKVYNQQMSVLQQIAEDQSHQEELQPYINNLDKVLGIKTINSCHIEYGVYLCSRHEHHPCHLCSINCDNVKELTLVKNELAINDKDYHWYLTAKKKDKLLFIVIGIPKKEKLEAVKYTLGKDETNSTILLKGDNF